MREKGRQVDRRVRLRAVASGGGGRRRQGWRAGWLHPSTALEREGARGCVVNCLSKARAMLAFGGEGALLRDCSWDKAEGERGARKIEEKPQAHYFFSGLCTKQASATHCQRYRIRPPLILTDKRRRATNHPPFETRDG